MRRTPVRPSLKHIARRTRPPRSTKPIRARGRKRFPKGYDKAYRVWIRTLPCLLADHPKHVCWGRVSVEPAHVRAEATGNGDRGQLIPLCCNAHRESPWSLHKLGRHSFPVFWRLGTFATLQQLALNLDDRYGALHPEFGGPDTP